MPVTYTIATGDGETGPRLRLVIVIPDSGQVVQVMGELKMPGKPVFAIPLTNVTIPAEPTSGFLWWQIQVDTSTGAVVAVSSTTQEPLPREHGPNMPLMFSSLQAAAANVPPSARLSSRTGDESTYVIVLKQKMSMKSAGQGLLLPLQLLPQTGLPLVQAGPIQIPNY